MSIFVERNDAMNFNQISNKLKSYTVGIAGCGGLGSNCAVALARTGIGRLIIADFDTITADNLNRQYYFYDQIGGKKVVTLRENIICINPNVSVFAHDIKLDEKNIPEIFKNCDVIVEAFDLAAMKKMIIETVMSKMPDKYIISGVGLAGWGKNDAFKTQYHGRLIICGDMETEVSDELPPLAARVAIVANMQANVVLEILLGKSAKKATRIKPGNLEC
jgi:sulfur carrier protein ThiS adenylyltransferase